MNKLFILFFFFFFLLGKSQDFILKDSLKIPVPDSYGFYQADIFNSLYFISNDDSSLLKYNLSTNQFYTLKNFTPSKKFFLVNPLFIVILDKINKSLEFYDDKLIATQDKKKIFQNQFINLDLIYIQDNKLLTYFDELTTRSFIQYDYRNNKNIIFSNSILIEIPEDYLYKEIFISRKSKSLLLKNKIESKGYRIITQYSNAEIRTLDIPYLENYFWSENNFFWLAEDYIYCYDFENEPKKLKLPQKGDNYYIFNQQLFLWKSKVMYLYQLKPEN